MTSKFVATKTADQLDLQASGLTALSSGGPGRLQQREDCTGSNAIGGNSSSTE
jgi:hypothetical protein